MELRRYLEILARRKWIIIIVAIVTIEIVVVASSLMVPVYSASTLVRIAQGQDGSINYVQLEYSDRLINTNVQLLQSRPFLEEVILRLSLPLSPAELSKQVNVQALPNTELIEITAQGNTGVTAANIAETLAALLIEEQSSLFAGPGKSARESLQEQLVIIEEDLQANRNQLKDMLGGAAGLVQLGSIEDLSTRIRIQEETYAMLLDENDRIRISEGLRANSISVVEPAIAPISPSKPNIPVNVALSVIVGLSAGIGLAFLFDNLDTRIHSSEDLTRVLNAHPLGWIPYFHKSEENFHGHLIMESDVRSPIAEAFRILRGNVLSLQKNGTPKVLMIASPEPDSGKSTILANLAASFAQSGKSVIVVDSDFGRPSLHKLFHLPFENGLSDVLFGLSTLEATLKTTSVYGVKVLTSGSIPSNSGDLLESKRLTKTIEALKGMADIILFDSPPLLAVADGAALAPLVDGVLLVIARHLATEKSINMALQQLEQVGAIVIGAVFNKADPRSGGFYFTHYNYIFPSKKYGNRLSRLFRRRSNKVRRLSWLRKKTKPSRYG